MTYLSVFLTTPKGKIAIVQSSLPINSVVDIAQKKRIEDNASVITNHKVKTFDNTAVITGWSVIRRFALLSGQEKGKGSRKWVRWNDLLGAFAIYGTKLEAELGSLSNNFLNIHFSTLYGAYLIIV